MTPKPSFRSFRSSRSLVAALLSVACACEEKTTPTSAPQSRSQAIQATGPAVSAAPPPVVASAPPPAAAPRKVLCAQQLGKVPKDVPKAAVARAGREAKRLLPEKLPTGPGHWTWINLWAAWCVPCKEEMPRLLSWEQKAAGERVTLKVAFVSLDDDARQLDTFLGAQPPQGVQNSYWLRDGQERTAWLKEAGMDGVPELPAHLLVDPNGKIRCTQQGAIEDADYVEVLKILRGERGGGGGGGQQQGEGKHGFAGAPAH